VLFKTHSAEDANSHLKFWREKKFDSWKISSNLPHPHF
jgi:hypothetical protein